MRRWACEMLLTRVVCKLEKNRMLSHALPLESAFLEAPGFLSLLQEPYLAHALWQSMLSALLLFNPVCCVHTHTHTLLLDAAR